jgi:AraC-like DNA-binding protein
VSAPSKQNPSNGNEIPKQIVPGGDPLLSGEKPGGLYSICNPKSISPESIQVAENKRKALLLRQRGASYFQIARELGYKSKATGYKLVRAALAEIPREAADALRQIELEHLNDLRLHFYPQTPADYLDWPRMDALLKVHDRIARLLGLHEPAVATTVNVFASQATTNIQQVAQQASANPRLLQLLFEVDEQLRSANGDSHAQPGTLCPPDDS